MARIRDGARGYVKLDVLHRENLDRVLDAFGLDATDEATRQQLTLEWHRLDAWPDVREGLQRLRSVGMVAPCSNGNIALMADLARHNGLHWDAIAGADLARDYKPKPRVYVEACEAFGLAAIANDDGRGACVRPRGRVGLRLAHGIPRAAR